MGVNASKIPPKPRPPPSPPPPTISKSRTDLELEKEDKCVSRDDVEAAVMIGVGALLL